MKMHELIHVIHIELPYPPPPTPVHMDKLSLHPKVGGVKEKEHEKEEKKIKKTMFDPHFFNTPLTATPPPPLPLAQSKKRKEEKNE